MSEKALGRELRVQFTPTLLFLDEQGVVALRLNGYLASALDYVASGAYRKEPSFQRYLQARAERLRGRGETVDLWN